MPNHTSSYHGKRGPTPHKRSGAYMRRDLGTLPGSKRNAPRRKDAVYLNTSHGNSRRNRSNYRNAGRRNSRAAIAFAAIGCAAVVFLATLIWYVNRSVDLTLNSETVSVRIHSSIQTLIEEQGLDEELKAGNLLAVDDSVLEKGAGERYSVKLDGKRVKNADLDSTEITGGEELEIEDGRDTYEEHDVDATDIEPTITVEGTGAIQYVETWGVSGRSEVWTGKVSGKTQDRGVVKEAVNCVVQCESANPADGKQLIALTFDEGPSSGTEAILKVLKEEGVKATFFLSGDSVEANASAAKAIADAGHEIGSNAMSDVDLTTLSGESLRTALTGGFDAIESATGVKTRMLRAPYASFGVNEWAQCADLLGSVISWNLDSGDWLLQGADTVTSTVVGSALTGNIVLLTDNDSTCAQTAEALPGIIEGLRQKGFEFVTLSELVESDENLSATVTSLTSVKMPDNAVLPKVNEEDE